MTSGKYIKTPQHRKNLSDALKGKPKSEEHKQHLRENHADMSGRNNSMFGKKRGPMTEEIKLKISNSMIGKNTWMKGKTGEKSTRWEGGITALNTQIRHSDQYLEWRVRIFKRDNYICHYCRKIGGDLEAHHIKRFSEIMKENNIMSFNASLICEVLWDLNNGITLCKECHTETKRNI